MANRAEGGFAASTNRQQREVEFDGFHVFVSCYLQAMPPLPRPIRPSGIAPLHHRQQYYWRRQWQRHRWTATEQQQRHPPNSQHLNGYLYRISFVWRMGLMWPSVFTQVYKLNSGQRPVARVGYIPVARTPKMLYLARIYTQRINEYYVFGTRRQWLEWWR